MDGLIRDDQVLRGDVARAAFEELVEKGAQVIIGGFLDEAVMGMIPSMARLRKPFLNTGTSGKQFSELVKSDYEKYKYYFRLMFNTEVLGQDAVGMAKGFMKEELGIQKVALVMEDSNFGRDFVKILQERLPTEAGVQIAKAINFPINNPDFNAILQQIGDSDADAIIPGFAFNTGVPFVGQTYELKVDAPVIGIITEGQAFEYWKSTKRQSIVLRAPTLISSSKSSRRRTTSGQWGGCSSAVRTISTRTIPSTAQSTWWPSGSCGRR
jgi:branched-chain amino acid transport system substrate-binding protein